MKIKQYYLAFLKICLSLTLISCSSTNNTSQVLFDDFQSLEEMPGDTSEQSSINSTDEKFALLPIPKSEIKSIDSSRNPFVAINHSSGKLSDLLPYGMRFTGIGTIGESKVLFTETRNQINQYKVGEEIGNGFKILNINLSLEQVKVTNGTKNYLIKFKQQ